LQWLDDTAAGPDLLCIVIFRGSWCKYDKHYLQKLGELHKKTMKSDNVKVIAWTSEGAAGAAKADKGWGLTEKYCYDAVLGDDTNALAKWLVEDEILPDLVTVAPEDISKDALSESSSSKPYPNGLVLPAVLWYAHHGNMVFQWAAKPPGGPGRPEPEAMYAEVIKRKHALDHGNAVMPSHGNDIKLCSTDLDIAVSNCSVM
jgi:hypothetical protein